MVRRFQQHEQRTATDLTGIWDFAFLGAVDPETINVEHIRFGDRMTVPGCFDATPTYAGKRGVAAYRRHIQLHDETPHRLIFDSVHHWCRVFVNGVTLCDHAGGFTQFSVDITDQPLGDAELTVLVDNQFNTERSPLHFEYFDWYHFGGITRPVELHRLGTHWINKVRVVTEDITTRRLTVTIDYTTSEPIQSSE